MFLSCGFQLVERLKVTKLEDCWMIWEIRAFFLPKYSAFRFSVSTSSAFGMAKMKGSGMGGENS